MPSRRVYGRRRMRADGAVALDEVDDAGRQRGLHRRDRHPARERRDLRRLDDDGVARDERGDAEQDNFLDGVVPGRADGDDAVRVADDDGVSCAKSPRLASAASPRSAPKTVPCIVKCIATFGDRPGEAPAWISGSFALATRSQYSSLATMPSTSSSASEMTLPISMVIIFVRPARSSASAPV